MSEVTVRESEMRFGLMEGELFLIVPRPDEGKVEVIHLDDEAIAEFKEIIKEKEGSK